MSGVRRICLGWVGGTECGLAGDRNSAMMRPMAANRIGIEIGGTKIQVVLGDTDGRITARRRFMVERATGAVGIQAGILEAARDLLAGAQLSAIGVGYGGPVDWRTGRVNRSHHVGGWSGVELGRLLADEFHVSVAVDNDANVAALGEALRGAGRGMDPVFYATLGSGVGGGVVLRNEIYHGDAPGEVEIGHVRLDKTGRTVESACSGWAVDRRIRAELDAGAETLLRGLVGTQSGGEARHLSAALQAGDALALRILSEVADDLALGLSHVTHLFHPQVLVLGGGLSLLGEPLRAAVAAALPGYLMQAFHPGPQVRLSSLGEDVVPVGALLLASQGGGLAVSASAS